MSNDNVVLSVQREARGLRGFGVGVIAELKPLGAVVHYRSAPYLENALRRAAEDIANAHPRFSCHAAMMAFELRPEDVAKDYVLRAWMAHAPFTRRVPIYVGDDLTDEPALGRVQVIGGVAIKVGNANSVARHRLASPSDLREALAAWARCQPSD